MALLQIDEPSMHDHQKRFAVGIDLGTTNSLVATMIDDKPSVLVDESDRALMPSVVNYQQDQILVGHAAQDLAQQDPMNTIVSIKRLMGRGTQDLKRLQGQLPYHFVGDENTMPKIQTVRGELSPVQISADILKALKARAQTIKEEEIAGAVITVPAYFDDAQRQATKDAATLAGLPVLRLLNEPTAAAVAYGLDQESSGIHVIYDLGGGTFDLSILQLHRGVFEVLATGGDSALGGDDVDHMIADWILQTSNFKETITPFHLRELLTIARQAKENLTVATTTNVHFQQWQGELTRESFDALVLPLIQKTLKICRQVLLDAKINLSAIDAVVLVGGATRMPSLRENVAQFFKKPPLTNIDPDKVVALGAAIQADILIGNQRHQSHQNLLLLDVLPLSLGLETMGGLMDKMIERNTPIPISRAQQFTTYQDGQTGIILHVVQGERELIQDCRSLAKFELTGIPPMKAGSARIEVVFQVDADGLLSVTATELSTGVATHVEIKPSYGLTEQEVTDMLKEAYQYAKEDLVKRELTERQVQATQLLTMLTDALEEDGEKYLSNDEREVINASMQALKEALTLENAVKIRSAQKAVDEVSQAFAQRRMEGSLKKALVGKTILEIDHAKN